MGEMRKNMVNVHEAKTHFSKLLARVEKGERITVARAGKPVARLIPAADASRGVLPPDDPLLNLDQWGFEGPGGLVSNAEVDRLVYEG
jgi:prevent-host-death family protein